MKPVHLPLEDVLDLHQFHPRDLASLVPEYLRACQAAGMGTVRIITGKGKGIQRARVISLIEKNPRVARFQTAPGEAGGWGALIVDLKPTSLEYEP